MLEIAAVVLIAAISTTFVTDLAGSVLKLISRRGARVNDEAHAH